MKVVARKASRTLLKIKILQSILSLQFPIEIVDDVAFTRTTSSSGDLVLILSDGTNLCHDVTVLNYIAESSVDIPLLDKSIINEELEQIFTKIEIPMQALMTSSNLIEGDRAVVVAKSTDDLLKAFGDYDKRLSSQTHLIGQKLSIADVSLFVSYLDLTKTLNGNLPSFPNVEKLVNLLASDPQIKAIVDADVEYLPALLQLRQNSFNKWDRHRVRVKELLLKGVTLLDEEVVVKGWVRTLRSADKGAVIFVELTDGSTVKGVQLVIMVADVEGAQAVADCGGAGASIAAKGKIVRSLGKGQDIEINVTRVKVLGPVYGGDNGEVGGKNYPMAKKKHTLEFLREKAHLRPRSKLFSAAMRVRHAMAFATHKFFNDRGFVYVHTPLITAADCEGAGEQFVVTTLLPEHAKPSAIPVNAAGNIDFSKDFFSRRCCLTVSGQLNVETHACALSDVYTFGPTFRAENSHTARHLAEFWMIEPEICFADLFDNMNLAEDYVKFCTAYALEHCGDDLHYLENEYPEGEKGLRQRLENVVDNDFVRITYTEAVDLVQKHAKEGKVQFETFPQWGDDLGSEHERYITEKVFGKPTIVINYPKGIKAFYMKLNDDQETVAAMDILVPKIGELIGGSQREDDLNILEQRCEAFGLKKTDIWWYSDLRRYGSVPHAGFGLGFERLVMFITGIENIRDVIPFPRVPGHAEF